STRPPLPSPPPPAPSLPTLSLHDALPIYRRPGVVRRAPAELRPHPHQRGGAPHRRQERGRPQPRREQPAHPPAQQQRGGVNASRSEEHTSELQSRFDLVCRLLLEKKKKST